jgi:hypothetical protein
MGRHRTDEPSHDEPTYRTGDGRGLPDSDFAGRETAGDAGGTGAAAIARDAQQASEYPATDLAAGPATESGAESDTATDGRWPPRRIFSVAMVAAGAFVLLAALWTGWRAYQAYSHLTDARTTVADISAKVDAGGLSGLDGVTQLTTTLAQQTAAARSAVDDPIFTLASHTPWIGENLAAVRGVATSMDSLAQAAKSGLPALAPLTDHGSWASGGQFDLAVLRPAAAAITRLDQAVQSAKATVTSIDRRSLVSPVNGALNEYGTQLATLSDMTTVGAQAANIVMPILGADGPRTYLIAFQNLAEARPTGGILAFYAELHVNDGRLTLGAAGSSDRGLGPFTTPVVKLAPAVTDLYWPQMALWPQDVNASPDFPRAATTFAKMYQIDSGTSVDGVIAIDPVVVSVLMKGTAPIDLGEGLTLSAESAVPLLSAGIYDAFPGGNRLAERDAMMEKAVGTAFTAVLGNIGRMKPRALIDDVRQLVDQRRVLVWSAHEANEEAVLRTSLAGRQQPDREGAPTVGVFLMDGNGGKMSYYLRASAEAGTPSCAADGTATTTLTITIRDTSPRTGLPPYVAAGAGEPGNYSLKSNLIITAPSAGDIGTVLVNGARVSTRVGSDNGRTVSIFSIVTHPGGSATITAAVTMSQDAQGGDGTRVTPRLITTPMAFPFPVRTESFTKCQPIHSTE